MILNIPIPDVVLASHRQDPQTIITEVQTGFIVWEYLSGRLSLSECAELLHIPYRAFLELLWSKGIPLDGLNRDELDKQTEQLRKLL